MKTKKKTKHFLLLIVSFLLMLTYGYPQNKTYTKNDTILYKYRINNKSKKRIKLSIKKTNLSQDTIITYGYLNGSGNRFLKKKKFKRTNGMLADSIFDRILFNSFLLKKGVFVDDNRVTDNFIAIAPQETYSVKIVFKDIKDIKSFIFWDRYLPVKNIVFINKTKRIDTLVTDFNINNWSIIKIKITSTLNL